MRLHVKSAHYSDRLNVKSLRSALPESPHLRFQQPNPTPANLEGFAGQTLSETSLSSQKYAACQHTVLSARSLDIIGLYRADPAAPTDKAPALSISTIDRRLSGLSWNHTQHGFTLDRKNRHIATVLAGIKRKHARPPVQKEAILDMITALGFGLRDLREQAILLIGYAGGLGRSEIVSLDVHRDDTPDSGGWIRVEEKGALLTLNAKTGWREVEIGRGLSD